MVKLHKNFDPLLSQAVVGQTSIVRAWKGGKKPTTFLQMKHVCVLEGSPQLN